MPVNSAERPGSSKGRGGNTQQEHDLLSNRSFSTNKFDHLSEKLMHVETILNKQAGYKHVTGEDVREILMDVMVTIDPKLVEKNVIDLISDFDVSETRELIATLRGKIGHLKDRIANGNESPVTRWMLGLHLASKEKTLEEHQDNWTTTPPSSDDEDEDERGDSPVAKDRDEENLVRVLKTNKLTEDQGLD